MEFVTPRRDILSANWLDVAETVRNLAPRDVKSFVDVGSRASCCSGARRLPRLGGERRPFDEEEPAVPDCIGAGADRRYNGGATFSEHSLGKSVDSYLLARQADLLSSVPPWERVTTAELKSRRLKGANFSIVLAPP